MKPDPDAAELYLDLMKKCLTRYIFPEKSTLVQRHHPRFLPWIVHSPIAVFLKKIGMTLHREVTVDLAMRAEGKDWPPDAETMVGLKRLDNLQFCIREVIREGVPGDFIETGAWRGGASILMRAALEAYADKSRQVWVADSFEGLPKADGRYAQDEGDPHWKNNDFLSVSLEQVKANFSRYGLLDERVHFLKGWFKDTLPTAPIEKLAILRLDGDMYSSTMDSLVNLYPKLSKNGYIIIDDYGSTEPCHKATEDFRAGQKIDTPLNIIDAYGVYWKKMS